jgi:4-hydroxyphenylpyruvate dioxygenase
MPSYKDLGIADFDHLEFAVSNMDQSVRLYESLGFEKVGSREIRARGLTSSLMAQNDIHILLSHSTRDSDPVAQYVARHGDGVFNLAFRCADAVSAVEIAGHRGAQIIEPPISMEKDFGSVSQASIAAFGDVRHTFISRKGALFAEGFEVPVRPAPIGLGLKRIDHVTTNVEKGQLANWSAFYEAIFGLENTRFFDIQTDKTGLYSKVMQSPDRVIKMPVNEPGSGANQIQEFINVNHGPGIQHIALETPAIVQTIRQLKALGVGFLDAPPETYYEAVVSRVPGLKENLTELQELAILIDGSDKGYLLQIFTQNLVGPCFYEVIQRAGDDGFGEGNFRSLFEAIERDQIRRGVLK